MGCSCENCENCEDVDYDDNISDTPLQYDSSSGCPEPSDCAALAAGSTGKCGYGKAI